jgi:CHRD domain-containing protein
MQRSKLIGTALSSGLLALWINHAGAQEFTAKLSGFNEIGSIPSGATYAQSYTGAVLSGGTGTATLDLDQKAGAINYKLTYSNVGTTPPQTGMVSQAHIHFGKSRDSGGILVFFCTNLTPPASVPKPQSCPLNSGTVTGTWTKADIVAIPGQNVVAGNFEALVEALESNTAYANIHTVPLPGATNTAYPGGEIRGQVHRSDREENQDNHDRNDNHQHN